MDTLNLNCLRENFKSIRSVSELRHTIQVSTNSKRIQISLWLNHTNSKAPWEAHVQIRNENANVWRDEIDFPWVQTHSEDDALIQALDFIEERYGDAADQRSGGFQTHVNRDMPKPRK